MKITRIIIFILVSFCANGQTNKQIDSLQNQINSLKEDRHSLSKTISEIKEKNDGRFEVLAWAASIFAGLVVIILGVNFYSANLKAEDIARDEIDKKTADIRKELKDELETIKKLREDIEGLILRTEGDIQTLFASTKIKSK